MSKPLNVQSLAFFLIRKKERKNPDLNSKKDPCDFYAKQKLYDVNYYKRMFMKWDTQENPKLFGRSKNQPQKYSAPHCHGWYFCSQSRILCLTFLILKVKPESVIWTNLWVALSASCRYRLRPRFWLAFEAKTLLFFLHLHLANLSKTCDC